MELRAKRMDCPPPAGENELPKGEMGQFVEPTIEKKLGLRTACFSDSEKNVTEFVISRNEENGNDVDALDENQGDTISNFNTGKADESLVVNLLLSSCEHFPMNHIYRSNVMLFILFCCFYRFLATDFLAKFKTTPMHVHPHFF